MNKNKLLTQLSSSSRDVYARRAESVAGRAKVAADEVLLAKRRKLQELDAEEVELSDFGPSSSTSLRPDKGFDPANWFEKLGKIRLEIALAKEEYAVYEATYAEYFGEPAEEMPVEVDAFEPDSDSDSVNSDAINSEP